MKGGGNNFGVVTNYRLQARRQGNVVGGNLVFLRTPSVDHQLLKAVRDFTEHNEDEKAAIIVTAERANLNLIDSWIIFIFYDGPVIPPGTFTAFTNGANIPILNTVRERTYADLMAFSNWVVIKGSVVDIGTETIPNASEENFEETIEGIHAFWRNMSSTVLDVPGIVASIAWQVSFSLLMCAKIHNNTDGLSSRSHSKRKLLSRLDSADPTCSMLMILLTESSLRLTSASSHISSMKEWPIPWKLPIAGFTRECCRGRMKANCPRATCHYL